MAVISLWLRTKVRNSRLLGAPASPARMAAVKAALADGGKAGTPIWHTEQGLTGKSPLSTSVVLFLLVERTCAAEAVATT